MKSIHEVAGGRAFPATAVLSPCAAPQVARASCPAPSMTQIGTEQSVLPIAPASTVRNPRPMDPEFRSWLEELL